MTTIAIKGLTVFGRHGVHPEETRLGQRFVIDLTVEADVAGAVAQDDYTQAVCYASLSDIAVSMTTGEPFQLIETLADRIAEAILDHHRQVRNVCVTVHKPSAPITHAPDDVAVSVTKARELSVGFSLGTNQGDREAVLALALNRLGTVEGITIERFSRPYRTAPWGVTDQPDFLNCCAVGRTTLTPHALLRLCKDIEIELGRGVGRRWGERLIDVDLLYVGDKKIDDAVLTLPHKHMHERAFVLVPLAEIDPDRLIGDRTVHELLNELPRQPGDVTDVVAEEE